MKTRVRQDTLAAEPCSGATDRFGRQPKVPRDIQSTHRKFDTQRPAAITALEHAQEHGDACACPETRQVCANTPDKEAPTLEDFQPLYQP